MNIRAMKTSILLIAAVLLVVSWGPAMAQEGIDMVGKIQFNYGGFFLYGKIFSKG